MKTVTMCHTREMGPFEIAYFPSLGFVATMEGVGSSLYHTYADLVDSMDCPPTPDEERAILALTLKTEQ